MTDKELEKKAFEYREKLEPYTVLGYPDVEIPVYEALDINRAYVAGAKELQEENEQLKQQIEKMKCCENCKHHSFWGNELKCNLLDYDAEFECLKSKNKWELAE